MQGTRILYKISVAGIFVSWSMLFFVTANAQTTSGPQFLITWSAANSYAPPQYSGKILPNQISPITASLELISPQGQVINLGGQIIYWYLDDNLLGGGLGVQHITFRPYGEAPNSQTVKVRIPNYPGGSLIHEINIPVAQPNAVIEAPYPLGQFQTSPISAQAVPYFFNASSSASLSFTWSVNGQPVVSTENPQTLQVSLPQSTPIGYAVAISLTIQNPNDSMTGAATANLTYQKQP